MEPSDAPTSKAAKKNSAKNIEDVAVPAPAFERGTSFVVQMEDDTKPLKPKPKHLRRLEEGNASPKVTKADLEAKQRKAEEKRQAELDAKTEFARENADKGADIVNKSVKEKKQAAKAINSKLSRAENKRDESLSAKKRAGQESSAKGKKARARRLDDALQAGKDNEIEGEDDGNYSDDDEVEM